MKRIISTMTFLGFTLLLLACPQQQAKQKVDYNDAERKLRMAVNINEMAYSSWNRVYESYGQLKKDGRVSEARWASVQAIDSIIVLSEADLIDGIDRSKKLLENWRKSSINLLTAESPQDVLALRESEHHALQEFKDSVASLTLKSLKLRDSYAEAMMVSEKAVKEGLPLPAEHLQAIRQVVKLVEMEAGTSRHVHKPATPRKESSPVAANVK